MAKPILVVRFDIELTEYIPQMIDTIKKHTDNEYHVLCIFDKSMPDIRVFNDSKGLPDVDIEKLIEEVKNNQS